MSSSSHPAQDIGSAQNGITFWPRMAHRMMVYVSSVSHHNDINNNPNGSSSFDRSGQEGVDQEGERDGYETDILSQFAWDYAMARVTK